MVTALGARHEGMVSVAQNFYSVPASQVASPQELTIRIEILDQLVMANPNSPGVQALQRARTELVQQLR